MFAALRQEIQIDWRCFRSPPAPEGKVEAAEGLEVLLVDVQLQLLHLPLHLPHPTPPRDPPHPDPEGGTSLKRKRKCGGATDDQTYPPTETHTCVRRFLGAPCRPGGGGPDRRSRAVQASQTRASTASVAASAAAQSLRVRRRSASRCPAYPANCRWAARLAQPHRSWEESGRGGSDHPLWLGTIPSVDPWWRLIRDFKKKPHEIMSEATQGRFPADRWGPLERWGRKHPRGGGLPNHGILAGVL